MTGKRDANRTKQLGPLSRRICLGSLFVLPLAACRSKTSSPESVLTPGPGTLSLVDHLSAAAVEMPPYPDPPDAETLDALVRDTLAQADAPPITAFPIEPENVSLHHLKLDPKNGIFTATGPGPADPPALEIDLSADLIEYDAISLDFFTEAGNEAILQWQCEQDTAYHPSRTVQLALPHGSTGGTFDVLLRPSRSTPLGAALWRSVRQRTERIRQIPLRNDVPTWTGKLKKLRFVPTLNTGQVTIHSITLRSTRAANDFTRTHPRESLLYLFSAHPATLYGDSLYASKMDVGGTLFDTINAFAPGRITYAVEIPAGAALRFGTSVFPPSLSPPITDVRFRIEAKLPKAPDSALNKTLFEGYGKQPGSRSRGNPPQQRLDLSGYAGRTVLLTLSATPLSATEGNARSSTPFVHWIDPTIVVSSEKRRPNVILFSADTLRPDHLGAYGYERPTSPNVDRLAAQGLTFTEAYTPAPWTLPAHMSMMTGLYPSHHGVDQSLGPAGLPKQLHPVVPTLASILREHGYYNVAVTDGGQVGSIYGFCKGFHRYFDNAGGRVKEPQQSRFTVDRFIRWVRENHDAPFFAFLHSYQPHAPLQPPPPFDTMFTDSAYAGPLERVYPGKHEKLEPELSRPLGQRFRPEDVRHLHGLYDGEIRFLDENLGRLVTELKRLGIHDRTVFVFTSDHGEEYGERDRLAAHGHTLYNELLRIPLIIRYPAKLPAGKRVDERASLIDLMPTVLNLLGIDVPPTTQGRPLIGETTGHAPVRSLFAESIRHLHPPRGARKFEKTLLDDGMKLIDYGDIDPNRKELYDLTRDPAEHRNLYEKQRAQAEKLTASIEGFRAAAPKDPAHRGPPSFAGDEQRLQKLKALGYLND